MSLTLTKVQGENLPSMIVVDTAKLGLPTYCNLSVNTEHTTTTTRATPYVDNMDKNCNKKIVTLKARNFVNRNLLFQYTTTFEIFCIKFVTYELAISGHNGKNESKVGSSKSLEIDFFDDNGKKISIDNIPVPIQLWIPRQSGLYQRFKYDIGNVKNMSLKSSQQVMPILVDMNASNSSLHVQLKPNNTNIGYLFLVKFGSTPLLNSTYSSYDHWKIFCPYSSDFYQLNSTNSSNSTVIDYYYLFFLDMDQVDNYKGFVGYGIRELTSNEILEYCVRNNTPSRPPILTAIGNSSQVSNFTENFSIFSYNSGCYYYTSKTGKWSNYGMKIYSDTNLIYTHCSTTHLTQFSGGFMPLANKINFEYAFANASPSKNPTIFAIVVTLILLYLIMSICAYVFDKKDRKRMGMVVLEDNLIGDNYFYEVIVFTGGQKHASTDSKVIPA